MIVQKITDFCQLFPEDIKLIELMRNISYGEMTVKLKNGRPVIVEKGIQTVKLEDGVRNA